MTSGVPEGATCPKLCWVFYYFLPVREPFQVSYSPAYCLKGSKQDTFYWPEKAILSTRAHTQHTLALWILTTLSLVLILLKCTHWATKRSLDAFGNSLFPSCSPCNSHARDILPSLCGMHSHFNSSIWRWNLLVNHKVTSKGRKIGNKIGRLERLCPTLVFRCSLSHTQTPCSPSVIVILFGNYTV